MPGWVEHTFAADGDAVLFSFSDRVVQEKLGLWRADGQGQARDAA